jgi:hypothetical protein
VATNALYAAPILGIDLGENLTKVYLPVLKEKIGYASLENLGDAVVGAAKLGVKDAALFKTLLSEIKKRPRDYKLVQQGTWNHGEC